jgi:hypothetical protein
MVKYGTEVQLAPWWVSIPLTVVEAVSRKVAAVENLSLI